MGSTTVLTSVALLALLGVAPEAQAGPGANYCIAAGAPAPPEGCGPSGGAFATLQKFTGAPNEKPQRVDCACTGNLHCDGNAYVPIGGLPNGCYPCCGLRVFGEAGAPESQPDFGTCTDFTGAISCSPGAVGTNGGLGACKASVCRAPEPFDLTVGGGLGFCIENAKTEFVPTAPSPDSCDALEDSDCNGRAAEGCGTHPEADCLEKTENSVDFTSGNVDHHVELASLLPGAGPPLVVRATYNSRREGPSFARGWLLNLDARARVTDDQIYVQLGNGYVMSFARKSAPAANELSWSPDIDDEVDPPSPRPYPLPAFVSRSLDGAGYGAYLAIATDPCDPNISCTPRTGASPRLILPDGQRMVFSVPDALGYSYLLGSEDAFGNRQVVEYTDFGGRRRPTRLAQGRHGFDIIWEFRTGLFGTDFNRVKAISVVRRLHNVPEQPLVTLTVDEFGRLEEVCATDDDSVSRARACGPRAGDSACEGKRTVKSFLWANAAGDLTGRRDFLAEVRDETCQRVESYSGWHLTSEGFALPERLETARENLRFDAWQLDSLGRVRSVNTEHFVTAGAAAFTATRTLNAALRRVESMSGSCGCTAPISRPWVQATPLEPMQQNTETIGASIRLNVTKTRSPGSTADPYNYGQPTTELRVDGTTSSSPPRGTSVQWNHPLYRRPTLVKSRQTPTKVSMVVYDFDDDDSAYPCVEGGHPTVGTPAANEAPTPFLCRILEYENELQAAPSRVTRYRYALDGRLLEERNPAGAVTTYFWERVHGQVHPYRLHDVFKGSVLLARYREYTDTGLPTSVGNGNGEFTTLTFDARDRLATATAPDGAYTRVVWEADGKPSLTTLPRGQEVRFQYGALGRLERAEWFIPGADLPFQSRRLAYDLAGNVALEQTLDGDQRIVHSVQRQFDSGRRLIRQSNALGGERRLEYVDNLLSRVTDEEGNITLYNHDGHGQLREVRARLDAAREAVSRYAFDGHGNLIEATDPNGNPTGYSFNGLGELTQVASKDTGLTTYSYTVDGLPFEKVDAQSAALKQRIRTEYDTLRRPAEIQLRQRAADGSELPLRILTRLSYDDVVLRALGRLAKVDDFASDGTVQSTTLSYDNAGRLESETHQRPGAPVPFKFEYRYLLGGKLEQIAYPPQSPSVSSLPTVLEFSPGADDEPIEVLFGETRLATVKHYPLGLGVAQYQRGHANLQQTLYPMDLDGRRTGATSPPFSQSYNFDRRGLVASVAQSGDAPRDILYTHDALGRLTSGQSRITLSPLAVPSVWNEQFTYDLAGNRLLKFRPEEGKRFESVFDWKGNPADKVPDNNLLRIVLDPSVDGGCVPAQSDGEGWGHHRLKHGRADDDDHGHGRGNGQCKGRGNGHLGGHGESDCRDRSHHHDDCDDDDDGQGGGDQVDAGVTVCRPRLSKKELARLRDGWDDLIKDAKQLLNTLPALTEAQLRGRVVGWFEKLRAWMTTWNLSGQTLLLLLFEAEAGPSEFLTAFTTFVDRRSDGQPLGSIDYRLLKTMLRLAERVPVEKAVVMDPNWFYRYDAAGNVTEVRLETPPVGLTRPLRTFFCYRHDEQRRLTSVEWSTQFAPVLGGDLPSPCDTRERLTRLAVYRFDSRNQRTYSNVLGLETHFLFSPDGKLLAEATSSGALQKQYVYLGDEPLAQVVLNDGVGSRPLPLARGCASAPGGTPDAAAWLLIIGMLALGSRRRGAARLTLLMLLFVGIEACRFEDNFLPLGKKPKVTGAKLKDPVYYFHNDRLGTPQRLTSEAGATVWRAEYRAFGNIERLEEDPDGNGVAVENNLRFPGQYDEALSAVLFQDGPYQNHHRWYSPDLGRSLSAEPLLQNPNFARAAAGHGQQVPAYSYAANSPLQYVDPDGLLFRGLTPALERTLWALENSYGSTLGSMVRELRTSPNIIVDFRELAVAPQWLKDRGGADTYSMANECSPSDPTRAAVFFNRDYAASAVQKKLGLGLTFDQLIAHELGHVWHAYSSATLLNAKGLDGFHLDLVHALSTSQSNSAITSLSWENAARVPGPYRARH